MTFGNVDALATCGRARQKSDDEILYVIKANEYYFVDGEEILTSILVILNLLAFGFYTAARLAVLAWREAVIAQGPTDWFFEYLGPVTTLPRVREVGPFAPIDCHHHTAASSCSLLRPDFDPSKRGGSLPKEYRTQCIWKYWSVISRLASGL